MDASLEQAHDTLLEWCWVHEFAGYDPFDALNSRIFNATPLNRSRNARLIWTQLFKRSPFNLRQLALVPRGKNSKGLALFALAALANARRLGTIKSQLDARQRLAELSKTQVNNFSGSAWGYNFDWQSRSFFAQRGTPTIVPTAFAARAFIEAHRDLPTRGEYLQTARSACDFILKDLNRSEESLDEVCFSYSPIDTSQIFNASLLAAETLASVAELTGENGLCELAKKAANYVVRRQRDDGSWSYGVGEKQQWIDSFHTAYVLSSLKRISSSCDKTNEDMAAALKRGYAFWRERFFLADGWPKYYHDRLYPADAHAAATAIVTFVELSDLDREALSLARGVANWAITHLRDRRGFFYYQKRRFYTTRTPYMRWTQAWMLYALARLLEAECESAGS
jgi:hypothetical protein